MTKIIVTDGLAQAGLDLLATVGEVTANPKITPEELIQVLPEYDALVVRSRTKVKANIIAAGTNLKVIGRAGVGVDNIDVPAALAKGITVVNSPLAATAAVGELTLGLMMALARNIPGMDASMKQAKWEKSAFMGSELSSKTLGLLGIGRIGSYVATLARVFGMKIIAFDPIFRPDEIRVRGAEPASFEEVLQKSDYISMHLPLTEQTRSMLSAEQFAMMKSGARLVCLARGGVVDEEALRSALDNGHLAGAALDVFTSEPPQAGSIAEHPKVIASPHVGAQTKEAQTRAGVDIAEEVKAALLGNELRWRVTANE